MNRLIIAALFLIALFGACRNNFDITQDEVLGPIPTVNVQTSLTGRVVDDQGNPVLGADVLVAGQHFVTDDRGLFIVNRQLMNKNGTHVRVSHSGYFDASRFAFPQLNEGAFIVIKMIPKVLRATFEASAGSTFQTATGAQIIIPPNAIAQTGGIPYNGSVRAFAVWLDPSASSTFDIMPGDLRAVYANGYAAVLTTFGMVGVELESPTGEKLNLLPDQKATIRMHLPGSLLPQAPPSIATWHFDDDSGYWKEEGTATIDGNQYVFEVPHFSFWNCDIPSQSLILNGRLVQSSGQPLTNYRISLTHESFGTGIGMTDTDGHFGGIVPANVPLQMQVTNVCGDVLYEQTVGPFDQNTDVGDIVVVDQSTVTVTGTLIDCNAQPVSNGLIFIEGSDTILVAITTDANGQFTATLSNCISFVNLVVTGFDQDNLLQSDPQELTILNGAANAGTLTACNNLDQFLTYTIDGRSKTFISNFKLEFGAMDDGYVGAGDTGQDSVYFSLNFENLVGMQANIQQVNSTIRDANNAYQSYGCAYCGTCFCSDLNAGTVQFTELPSALGEYVAGTASGLIRSVATNTPVPYSVQFRFKFQ